MTLTNSVISAGLIGRFHEFERLQSALTAVQQSQGQTHILVGEAGIGKSRLVSEIELEAQQQGFRVLAGHCFELDSSFPFAPIIDAFRIFLAAYTIEETAVLLHPFTPELLKLLPELAFTFPDMQAAPSLDPESEKRRLFETLVQFITNLASSSSPLLLIIEDIHWADETSLDFLHLLARRLPAYPILLLLTRRQEETTHYSAQTIMQLERQRLVQTIALSRLNRTETDLMLQQIFQLTRPIQPAFLHTIHTLTDGNPFFIEEVIKSLMSAGEIFYENGRWDRKPLEELHTPPTVLAAVQQRTLRLSPAAHQLLTMAAVVGRRFNFNLLQALTSLDEEDLLEMIKELIAAQLLVEETADSFAFRHALTRQAIYDQLLTREQRSLHQKIAEMLAKLYPNSDTILPILAFHTFRAEMWQQALDYAWQAGVWAQTQHAPYAALEQFNHALSASQQLNRPPSSALLYARGQTYERLGDFEGALADYTLSLAAARDDSNLQATCQSLLALGFLWSGRDYERSGDYLRQALKLARDLGDPVVLGHSLNRIGNWYANMERPLTAQQYHQEALSLFQQLEDVGGLAVTYDLLGTTSYMIGDMPAGIAYYEQAIPLFRQKQDYPGLISCLASYSGRGANYLLGTMAAPPIPLSACAHDAAEAVALAQKIGWRAGESLVRLLWGFKLVTAGEYAQALNEARIGQQLAIEIEVTNWQILAQALLGVIYADLLQWDQARISLEWALALAQSLGALEMRHSIVGFLAPVLIAQGELDTAESLLTTALPPIQAGFEADSRRFAWYAQADLALAQLEYNQALSLVEQLLAFAPNADQVVPRLWHIRAQALMGLNGLAKAEALLVAAQATADAQGARPLLWRNHITLGRLRLKMRQREQAEQEFAAAQAVIMELAAHIPETDLATHFRQQALAAIPAPPQPTLRQAEKRRYSGLTRREREIAVLVAAGLSNQEIATRLIIGERTVETHVTHILNKLKFNGRSQIAAWAVKVGLTTNIG